LTFELNLAGGAGHKFAGLVFVLDRFVCIVVSDIANVDLFEIFFFQDFGQPFCDIAANFKILGMSRVLVSLVDSRADNKFDIVAVA
jgi:hypothetical protein